MSPEHHLTKDFHTKHMELHQKYPEKFHPDSENTTPSLPTYFGNVCLRFIPVFDIVVHRYSRIHLPTNNRTKKFTCKLKLKIKYVIIEYLGF